MARRLDAKVSLGYIYTYIQTAELRSDLSEFSVQMVEKGRV